MEPSELYSDSPFLTFLAPVMEEWRDGYARVRLDLRPQLLNRSGVVHGGVIASLLDHACGVCGLYCTVPENRRYALTLSLNTSFMGQSTAGRLIFVGERQSSGRRIYFSSATVRTEAGDPIASGTGVFRYRTGSESLEGVPRRHFDTD